MKKILWGIINVVSFIKTRSLGHILKVLLLMTWGMALKFVLKSLPEYYGEEYKRNWHS